MNAPQMLFVFKQSFISIPFVLSKIWPMAQTGIHYGKKWLRGDNYVNIQGRIMALVHCPFPDCHLSINQVSFQFLLYFPRYGPDKHPLWKINSEGEITQYIYRVRLWFSVYCPSSHYHLSINPTFISIPFILSKIWPIMGKKWLMKITQ